ALDVRRRPEAEVRRLVAGSRGGRVVIGHHQKRVLALRVGRLEVEVLIRRRRSAHRVRLRHRQLLLNASLKLKKMPEAVLIMLLPGFPPSPGVAVSGFGTAPTMIGRSGPPFTNASTPSAPGRSGKCMP